MNKIVVKSIVDGWLIGVALWLISQVGLLLSYYALGPFLGSLFLLLADWPNLIFLTLLPKELPNTYYENAYPISCVVSLIGWLILAMLISFGRHMYVFNRKKYGDGSDA